MIKQASKTKTKAAPAAAPEKPKAMTACERQRLCRQSRKNDGLHEVRSIHAFKEDHATIKAFANDLTAKTRAAKLAEKGD